MVLLSHVHYVEPCAYGYLKTGLICNETLIVVQNGNNLGEKYKCFYLGSAMSYQLSGLKMGLVLVVVLMQTSIFHPQKIYFLYCNLWKNGNFRKSIIHLFCILLKMRYTYAGIFLQFG